MWKATNRCSSWEVVREVLSLIFPNYNSPHGRDPLGKLIVSHIVCELFVLYRIFWNKINKETELKMLDDICCLLLPFHKWSLKHMNSTCITFERAVPGRLVTSFSLWRPVFTPKTVHVGFVVDKVALVQVLLKVLQFFCQYHFIDAPHPLMYHLVIGQWAC
jgi:hypothetical protein